MGRTLFGEDSQLLAVSEYMQLTNLSADFFTNLADHIGTAAEHILRR